MTKQPAAFTGLLLQNRIAISMDGRGAWRDHVFVERLWRSVKYQEVYLRAYDSVAEARASIGRYLASYNRKRPHSHGQSERLGRGDPSKGHPRHPDNAVRSSPMVQAPVPNDGLRRLTKQRMRCPRIWGDATEQTLGLVMDTRGEVDGVGAAAGSAITWGDRP
jgi:hypothetical protein